MLGIFYILLFWAVGNGISLLMGGYLPGSIIGMILLFAALCLRLVRPGRVRPAARFLLGSMALFFIPYGAGLVESYGLILDHLWAIVLSAAVSTVLVLLCTGHVFQKLNRRSK
ncbi:MAG: CidA/LrgA family protein [Alistipes sp.]|nr:CidA/LrgA family protein [Alistipes sp.]